MLEPKFPRQGRTGEGLQAESPRWFPQVYGLPTVACVGPREVEDFAVALGDGQGVGVAEESLESPDHHPQA